LVAAFSPGAIVVEVARQYEVSTGLIYKWRAEAMVMGTRATGEFVPALIVEDPPDKSEREPAPAIVVELASGVRVTISGSAAAAAITRFILSEVCLDRNSVEVEVAGENLAL
jgi:transposase